MRLIVDPALVERFPDLVLGVAVVHGLDNTGTRAELARRLAAAQAGLAERFGSGLVPEHPRIAPWREAYRAFGAKPKDYPSSIENLVRRVLKGGTLPAINPLVDLYNVVSLEQLLPVGGEDLDTLQGDVQLTFAGPDEPAVLLLGEPEPRAPKAGEVIYRDELGAICRRWNWKEADRSKLTAATRNAVLVVEGLPPAGRAEIEAALAALARLVREHCGGAIALHVLDREQLAISLAGPPI